MFWVGLRSGPEGKTGDQTLRGMYSRQQVMWRACSRGVLPNRVRRHRRGKHRRQAEGEERLGGCHTERTQLPHSWMRRLIHSWTRSLLGVAFVIVVVAVLCLTV